MLIPTDSRAIRCVFCGTYFTSICAHEAIVQFRCTRNGCGATNTIAIKGDHILQVRDNNMTGAMLSDFFKTFQDEDIKLPKLVQYDGIRHLELD